MMPKKGLLELETEIRRAEEREGERGRDPAASSSSLPSSKVVA